MSNNVMIIERSGSNLQKISKNGKVVLEGVFAEFGVENRNGRVYEEKEYLPHLEYLKKDMANGNLLGELDHPERFEVSLNNVSHRVTDLWYDQSKRQILGRIEVLEGTPKGQTAKALLDAGVPLSISSRAAGTVNEDKTVQIQQIYTYDLVAKPGFEAAQLHSVNESAQARISGLIQKLNESFYSHEKDNISNRLGIVNENISIIDVSDKYPSFKLREEAMVLNKNNNKNNEYKTMKEQSISEEAVQKWTIHFNNEISKINEKLNQIESATISGTNQKLLEELKGIKKYIEKLRSIQENALNWQSDIAKAVNKVGNFADTLATKSNEHYDLTQKISETVDYNAKVTNHTLDWTSQIAESLNEGIQNIEGLSKWNKQLAKATNGLNEWLEEDSAAINDMHEWVSDIAKHTNGNINYAEDMFGRAVSKDDAKQIMDYISLVEESKATPEAKEKINEMLSKHSITSKPLNEGSMKGLDILDANAIKPMKKQIVGDIKTKNSGVEIDKNKTIVAKLKNVKFSKQSKPKNIDAGLEADTNTKPGKVSKSGKVKGIMTIDCTKTIGGKASSNDGSKIKVVVKDQNLKLDVKPQGKLKEEIQLNRSTAVQDRSAKLFDKLDNIVNGLEKERAIDEQVKTKFPFTGLLSESDRKRFADLSQTDKEKVSQHVTAVATTDAEVINQLWENALVNKVNKNDEPLWLKAAPKKYREAYDSSNDIIKESVKAKSEFFILETQYQINDFWERSGIVQKPSITLNESIVSAGTGKEVEQLDSFVNQVGDYMKTRYNG